MPDVPFTCCYRGQGAEECIPIPGTRVTPSCEFAHPETKTPQ